MVMDARSGEVLHSRNADTRLHPASLTKMMTLYITFEAVRKGEISMDTMVTISKKAANEPPSKLGMKPGQKIKLRYLVRAAAVKSANDAATAIGEAIEGSEAAFARRMNRTAQALGMTRTTFKNAHGLTESGHLSTARDMTVLGRRLFYDYPEYYNLFSRRTTDAGIRKVSHTNRRFLDSYPGADGIKTGYTSAAGFNLVASAQHGNERIITTVFGGRSTSDRNAKVAELMDMGFRRAPSSARVSKPPLPVYSNADPETAPVIVSGSVGNGEAPAAGKVLRLVRAPSKSIRPPARPGATPEAPADEVLLAMADDINSALQEAQASPQPVPASEPTAVIAPEPEPKPEISMAEAITEPEATPAAELDDAIILAEAETVEIGPAPAAEPEPVQPQAVIVAAAAESPLPAPKPRPEGLVLASASATDPIILAEPVTNEPEVVTRLSTSGGRFWGINVGRYNSRYEAERILLKTALNELGTLDEALRKVVPKGGGFDANFVGMTQETAALACRRLAARSLPCETVGPS
ncbi:MAG: serine hydrolase [Paracoccaceae bacterium]